MTIDIPEGYEVLGLALGEAVAQAACGKGSERHAEKGERFSDQLIMSIPKRLGPGGECFCLGQALKKICESRRLAPAAARAELLGAVNYIAAAWSLLGGTEGVPEEKASRMAARSGIASAPEDADAPRTKDDLVRRIREVNPAVYQPEDREAPLFPERTPRRVPPSAGAGVDAGVLHRRGPRGLPHSRAGRDADAPLRGRGAEGGEVLEIPGAVPGGGERRCVSHPPLAAENGPDESSLPGRLRPARTPCCLLPPFGLSARKEDFPCSSLTGTP